MFVKNVEWNAMQQNDIQHDNVWQNDISRTTFGRMTSARHFLTVKRSVKCHAAK
jgi:hypothetical protein